MSEMSGQSGYALPIFHQPVWVAGSTDGCNTFRELLSWGLIEQGLSRPFVELPCDGAKPGLAMQGQIGASRKILAQQSVGVFVRAALPGRPRVTKIDLDLGGQCQALMIGELFASVLGQRPVKFTGQSLRLFDQRRDDAFSILVRDLGQHDVARMTLDKRCDIAVPGSADQVALPMARHGAIFNRRRPFADGHGILYLAEPIPFQAGVPGAADGALGSQVLKQFLFSTPRAWMNRLR